MIEYLADFPVVELIVILLATFLAAARITERVGHVESAVGEVKADVKKVDQEVRRQGKQQARLKKVLYRHVNSKKPPCSTGSQS